MKSWTSNEIQTLWDHIDLSTKEIYLEYCDVFGTNERSYDSVQKKVKELRGAHCPGPEEENKYKGFECSDMQELEDAFAEILGGAPTQKLIIPEVSSSKRKRIKEEAQEWLQGLIEFQPKVIKEKETERITQGKSLCVLISDTHVGKHTREFNLQEAEDRITNIPSVLYDHEGAEDIDEVVILLAGDLVEGEDIYPTQASNIECPAIEQVQVCVDSLWKMILKFRQLFECRISVYSVPGNHGRISKTANEKTNWDNIVYYALQTIIRAHEDSEIKFEANYDEFFTFEVQDKVGMMYHQGVKHTGTPAMREKVAGWADYHEFDFMCHGHWHEWHIGTWTNRIVVANGCLCGPDNLSERMGKGDTAKQAYFKVYNDRPITGFGYIEFI